MISQTKIIMNCAVKITAIIEDNIFNTGLIDLAFAECKRIEDKFTRFKESYLTQVINQKKTKVRLDAESVWLIKKCIEYYTLTNGIFDPCIIDQLDLGGYLGHNSTNLAYKHSISELTLNGMELSKPDTLRLDFGGIGKGYAIDKMYEVLSPLKNFLIDAGGDVRVCGEGSSGKGWIVALWSPDSSNKTTILHSGEALACSSKWARKIGEFHHIIDPITGKPADNSNGVYYYKSDTAMEADVMATVGYIRNETE